MNKRLMVTVAITLSILLLSSCFDGPWTDRLNVPYIDQDYPTYCAIACIQMWAHFDGYNQTDQYMIASWVGVWTNGAFPDDVAYGVSQFTNSTGYVDQRGTTNFEQDLCIAASIAGIKDNRPSIVPFAGGTHAVLAIGYTWHYQNSIRIADKLYYHDPNPNRGEWLTATAADLKSNLFLPVQDRYFMILGAPGYREWGEQGYWQFIAEGGTFYGGPSNYDPLDFDPSTAY